MLKNYLLITLRNLLRHKVYTLINVLGLTFGLTCAILLFLYIQDELSFDHHQPNLENIYRVRACFTFNGKDDNIAATPGPLASVLKKDYPEVAYSVRFLPEGQVFMRNQENKLYVDRIAYVDSSWLKVFSYEFLAGDPKTALLRPQTMIFTESLAKKFFKNPMDALGKSFRLNEDEKSYEVTAIIKDVPKNSNYDFTGLISMHSLPKDNFNLSEWGNVSMYTFVLLKPGANSKALDKKMQAIFKKYMEKGFGGLDLKAAFFLQPLKDVHFSTTLNFEYGTKANPAYLYIFSAIAVFVLLIASINYMNLATARSLNRAKEVGIRKVLGSHKTQLRMQFIAESVLITLIAFLISLLVIELVLPAFNQIAGKDLSIPYLESPQWVLLLLGMVVLLGIFSGTYPAFFLSAFNPVIVLKGKFANNRKSAVLRRVLVVVQFTISIVMIIGTWIVYQQLRYVNKKDLGFQKDQVLVVELDNKIRDKAQVIKEKILQHPQVKGVSGVTATPGGDEQNVQGVMAEKDGQMKETLTHTFFVDEDFVETLGIQLIAGRNYSKEFRTDTSMAVIVNETFARKQGWKEAIGKKFLNLGEVDDIKDVATAKPRKVIGLMRDFHLNSLHRSIEPLAIYLSRSQFYTKPSRLLIKLNSPQAQAVMGDIQTIYEQFDQEHPFKAYFLDKNFAKQYENDQKRGTIFFAFSVLTILIACLGLFGLASFTAEQRRKEIGVRKVLGASVPHLLYLVSREFLALILWASLIAFPIAYFVMNRWLQDFAYRTEVWENWFVFLLSGAVALLIALLTVSFQAFKAASVNPVHVLRNE